MSSKLSAALSAGNLAGDLEALSAQRAAEENLEHETPWVYEHFKQINAAGLARCR